MTLDQFIAARQANWRHLEALLKQAEQDVATLPEDRLHDLGRLYRLAASDLALAQRDFPSHRVALYLNGLIGRAHVLIYRGEPLRWQQLPRFYATTFPALYRRLWRYTLAAFLLFALPALAGLAVVWNQQDAIYPILGASAARLVQTVEEGKLWTEIAPAMRSAGAGLILTNNIQVMFLTFAGSLTGGLLTAWALVSNGLQFGALFGLLQRHGLSGGLAQFVCAHGFIELSVIFLAGGCGLYVADGLLRPGLLSRRSALAERAVLAVRLILGCVPLLILAGLIEGFISPSSLPWPVKLAVGLTTGGALYIYWWLGGTKSPSWSSAPNTG